LPWQFRKDLGQGSLILLSNWLPSEIFRFLDEPAPAVSSLTSMMYNVGMQLQVWLDDESSISLGGQQLYEQVLKPCWQAGVDMPFQQRSRARPVEMSAPNNNAKIR